MRMRTDFVTYIFFKLRNEWPKYFIFSFWLILNITAFLIIFIQFETQIEYFYLRKIVNSGVSWAKASAVCLNINCAVILLLVCRNMISYIRNFLCCPRNITRSIDRHISYHRYVGYLILFFSIIHTLAHIYIGEFSSSAYNFESNNTVISNTSTIELEHKSLIYTLSLLPYNMNGSLVGGGYLNPIRKSDSIVIIETVKLVGGLTGIIMCVVLAIMASSSSEYIRRSFFNLFWYLHQVCAIIFMVAFCVHGAQMIVRRQINVDKHNPQQCYREYSYWSKEHRYCDVPDFAGFMPTSWMYVLAPISVFILERIIRFVRSTRKHTIARYRLHPSNVLELQIDNSDKKNKIKYRAGQYVFLNVSEVSYLEWHPYTITSSPNDHYLTVHVRKVGDWTSRLIEKMVTPDNKTPGISEISVDGPFGTSAENILKYEKVVLIGAGIGVTPYASILKDIWYHLGSREADEYDLKLKKVYFFWIFQTIDSFEWFGEMLKKLEDEMITKNRANLLEFRLYLTKGWSQKDAISIIDNNVKTHDIFTGLKQKTHYGRPDFDKFFRELSISATRPEKIGVFFCGSQQLSSQLHETCNRHSNATVRFFYNKECF